VTRVEGHGKVTILLDDQHRVHQVRLHIVEFRGFERFIQGRPYWEVPVMVQRLCGICPVSHHLAASKALDRWWACGRCPADRRRVRRLMHYGQILQSHALHFFHLSSPDLLFGFDSDPGPQRGRRAGRLPGARAPRRPAAQVRPGGHPHHRRQAGPRHRLDPGRREQAVTPAERDELAAPLPDVLAWAQPACGWWPSSTRPTARSTTTSARVPSACCRWWRPTARSICTTAGCAPATPTARSSSTASSRGLPTRIHENVRSWSYMKFPFIAALGPERGWYKVGPLARHAELRRIGTPLAEAARQELVARRAGGVVHAPLAYHWARMIELLHAAEVIASCWPTPRCSATS
jgi:NAD-reducing hydrogenase large subunit